MLIQFTGLSGAGKTSIAYSVKALMAMHRQLPVEVIDADEYRKTVCKDLGFSREDRCENIRRLGRIAAAITTKGCIAIIAAINPYEAIRTELKEKYKAKTIWIHCPVAELIKRDTKGLYHRSLLPDGDSRKICNLSGMNDPYEMPLAPDLILHTANESLQTSTQKLYEFILSEF